MADDVVEEFEDPVREPVFGHGIAYVSCGLRSGRFAGKGISVMLGGGDQFCRETPARLIDEKSGVGAWLVGKPDFYGGGLDALFMPDLRQALWETFLNLRPRRRPERDGEDEPKGCDSPWRAVRGSVSAWRPRRGIPRKSIGGINDRHRTTP